MNKLTRKTSFRTTSWHRCCICSRKVVGCLVPRQFIWPAMVLCPLVRGGYTSKINLFFEILLQLFFYNLW